MSEETEKEPNICDNCQNDCEDLYTRQGFKQTFFVEWVCRACFKLLEGVDFADLRDD